MLTFEDYLNQITETAYEKDIDPDKKIIVKGVKGMKSTPLNSVILKFKK